MGSLEALPLVRELACYLGLDVRRSTGRSRMDCRQCLADSPCRLATAFSSRQVQRDHCWFFGLDVRKTCRRCRAFSVSASRIQMSSLFAWGRRPY